LRLAAEKEEGINTIGPALWGCSGQARPIGTADAVAAAGPCFSLALPLNAAIRLARLARCSNRRRACVREAPCLLLRWRYGVAAVRYSLGDDKGVRVARAVRSHRHASSNRVRRLLRMDPVVEVSDDCFVREEQRDLTAARLALQ